MLAKCVMSGIEYERIEKIKSYSIYSLRYVGSDLIIGYDVIKGSGQFPKTEEWGIRAWSFTTLTAARNKIQKSIL